MDNLIKESLTKLKQKNINNPELDLRILLKHASKKNNEIIMNNLNTEDEDTLYKTLFSTKKLSFLAINWP